MSSHQFLYKILKILVIIISFLTIFSSFSSGETLSKIDELQRIEVALDRTFDYILVNYKEIHLDGLFGVVFAQGHLDAILLDNSTVLSNNERLRIEKLKTKADHAYGLIKPRLYIAEAQQVIFLEELIDPKLWQRNITFRKGLILPTAPSSLKTSTDGVGNDLDSLDKYLVYLSKTNMSEMQSDECILELIAMGSKSHKHECPPSDFCQRYIVDDPYYDPTYGITHRLLYLQIARTRNCTLNKKWYSHKTKSYCSYILWEATKNAQFGFIEDLDDILFEQITLCGYEGFTEFFNSDFVDHVLEAQSIHGCFGIPLSALKTKSGHRQRRNANLITHGCNDHTTGLGASTLALTLRYLKLG